MSTDEKKYRLTDEMQTIRDYTLFRIEALRDFADVKKGDLGGFIEKERNLAHEGNCWVYGNARVYDRAEVSNEAQIMGNATVSGRARVYENAIVTESANVWGNTRIRGRAIVSGEAMVHNHAIVNGDATVYGKALVYHDAEVKGQARIFGYAKVTDCSRVEGTSVVAGRAHLFGYSHVSKGEYYGTPTDDPLVCIGPFSDKSGVQIWVTLEKQSGQINSAYFSGNLDEFEVWAAGNLNIDVFAISSFLKSFMTWK